MIFGCVNFVDFWWFYHYIMVPLPLTVSYIDAIERQPLFGKVTLNMLKHFKIMKNKRSPYRFVLIFNPGNSNGRCSGTFLTGNTCVTDPVIGGGVLRCVRFRH